MVGLLAGHGRGRPLPSRPHCCAPRRPAPLDLGSELLLAGSRRARQQIDTVNALLGHTSRPSRRRGPVPPRIQLLLNALKITAAEQCYAAVDDLVAAVGLRDGYLKDSATGLEAALRDLRSAALNYSNDRLHQADGRLALLDPEVRFV